MRNCFEKNIICARRAIVYIYWCKSFIQQACMELLKSLIWSRLVNFQWDHLMRKLTEVTMASRMQLIYAATLAATLPRQTLRNWPSQNVPLLLPIIRKWIERLYAHCAVHITRMSHLSANLATEWWPFWMLAAVIRMRISCRLLPSEWVMMLRSGFGFAWRLSGFGWN